MSNNPSVAPAANSVMVLHPYKQHPASSIWVFDDSRHDLVAEPFVGQINDMMDRLLEAKGISTEGLPYAFSLVFSAAPIPSHDLHLEWVSGDTKNETAMGNIYTCPAYGIEGWLCPALFHYFGKAPEHIYIKVEAGKGS